MCIGLPAAKLEYNDGDLPPSVPFYGGVRVDRQAHFNSYSYMVGIAEVLRRAGVPIFEMSRVNRVRYGEFQTSADPHELSTFFCSKKSPHRVVTVEGGEIMATNVVLATHLPFLDRTGHFAVCSPSRSYCIAFTLTDPSKMIRGKLQFSIMSINEPNR